MTPQPPPHIGQAEGEFTGDETWLAALDETGARQHPFDVTITSHQH